MPQLGHDEIVYTIHYYSLATNTAPALLNANAVSQYNRTASVTEANVLRANFRDYLGGWSSEHSATQILILTHLSIGDQFDIFRDALARMPSLIEIMYPENVFTPEQRNQIEQILDTNRRRRWDNQQLVQYNAIRDQLRRQLLRINSANDENTVNQVREEVQRLMGEMVSFTVGNNRFLNQLPVPKIMSALVGAICFGLGGFLLGLGTTSLIILALVGGVVGELIGYSGVKIRSNIVRQNYSANPGQFLDTLENCNDSVRHTIIEGIEAQNSSYLGFCWKSMFSTGAWRHYPSFVAGREIAATDDNALIQQVRSRCSPRNGNA